MSSNPRLSRSSSRGASGTTLATSNNTSPPQQQPAPGSIRLSTGRSPYVNNLSSTQIILAPLTGTSDRSDYSFPATYNDVFPHERGKKGSSTALGGGSKNTSDTTLVTSKTTTRTRDSNSQTSLTTGKNNNSSTNLPPLQNNPSGGSRAGFGANNEKDERRSSSRTITTTGTSTTNPLPNLPNPSSHKPLDTSRRDRSSSRISRKDMSAHVETQQQTMRSAGTTRLGDPSNGNGTEKGRKSGTPSKTLHDNHLAHGHDARSSSSNVRISAGELMSAEEGTQLYQHQQNTSHPQNTMSNNSSIGSNGRYSKQDLLLLSSTNMMHYSNTDRQQKQQQYSKDNHRPGVITEENEDGDDSDYDDDYSNDSHSEDHSNYDDSESENDALPTPNSAFNGDGYKNSYPLEERRPSNRSNNKSATALTNFDPQNSQLVLHNQSSTSHKSHRSSISMNRNPSSTSHHQHHPGHASTAPTIAQLALSPLPTIEAPYQKESFQQLTDISTVPREVYLDYIQQLRRPGQMPHPDNPNQSMPPVDVPKEVEHWTVKLPTRLEFKNVTIRVNKKFPVNQIGPAPDPASQKPRTAPPGAEIEPELHPDAIRNGQGTAKGGGAKSTKKKPQQQYTPSTNSDNGIEAGFEFDLDAGDDNDASFEQHRGDIADPNNTDNEMDDDEVFSPSSFKRKQDAQRLSRKYQRNPKNSFRNQQSPSTQSNSVSVHRPPPSNRKGSISTTHASIHSTQLGYNIPKPNQLFDDSDDEESFENPNKKKGLCGGFCSSEQFETRPVTILDNLSGCIEPGSMVAIMGGSGAGKTTLLNALSGRVPLVDVSTAAGMAHLRDTTRPINSGSICFNGTRVTESELASMTGYVMQNDVFLGTLTPRETLQFAAKLQLPPAISEQRRLKRVERVIQQLDLEHIGDSPIGGMFSKGISGGQKRRVSVGIELIKDPAVIFLDEPTSGLDSTTAVNVMRVLKHLAQTGRTVIFTIHSPNSKILELFDTMILLSRGRLAYFGPAKQTLPYFASLGYDCPLFSNPAEFFLNVLTPNTVSMFHTMLHNTHHSPEDMLTPMDPRWKSVVLLRAQQGYHGYKSSSPIPLLLDKNTQSTSSNQLLTTSSNDWTHLYLGYGDNNIEQSDNWAVYVNGVKHETLRQKRRRHLIETQHQQYSLLHEYRTINETEPGKALLYRTSTHTNGAAVWDYTLFPQSTHIYQQLLLPPSDSGYDTSPPPPNPLYLSSAQYQGLVGSEAPSQLYDIDEILLERENKRLSLVTDTYLRYPIQPNHQLSPFLSNYIPKLRVLDKEGAVALQEIGFDFRQTSQSTLSQTSTSKRRASRTGSSAAGGTGNDERQRKIDIVQPGKAALPWFDQLKVLTHRTFLHTIRDPLNTVARVAVNILLSIFVGLLFFQTGDAQSSLYARVGFIFFMTSIQAFITVMGAVLTFAEERALFIREYHKQIYATSSYFLGRTIIDITMQTILAVIFGALAYPMVGLQPSFATFVQYSICLVMVAQGTHSYALVLGALVPYRTVALMLSPVVMVPFLTVSGFLCPLNALSPAIAWLAWFSPQRWMFEAMMNLELVPLAFTCQPDEFITVPLDNGTMERLCPVLTGLEVLSLFGLSHKTSTFIVNVVAVLIISVVVKVVALFSLKFSAWWTIKTSTGA